MARWSAEKRAQVRTRIMAEASALFEAEGFEGTTMRAVAKASGLGVGTVFNYFPDKLALLHEVLHEGLEGVMQRCVATMPGIEAGLEGLLVHTAGCFFDHYAARPALSRALLKESLWATGPSGARFQAQVEALGRALVERLTALREAGALGPQASPPHIALAFFSHYYFVLLMELKDAPDTARMRATIAALARQLEAGVGPPGTRPRTAS